jgi:hypothetical protein
MSGKNIYEVFKTNEQAENEGLWFGGYGQSPSGRKTRFLLARMSRSNKAYTNAVQRMHDEYGQQLEMGTLDDDTAFELMLDIFVNTVLLDWDGVADRDGNDLPFSKENAKRVLTDLPDLYADLNARANKRDYFLEKRKEEDAGN